MGPYPGTLAGKPAEGRSEFGFAPPSHFKHGSFCFPTGPQAILPALLHEHETDAMQYQARGPEDPRTGHRKNGRTNEQEDKKVILRWPMLRVVGGRSLRLELDVRLACFIIVDPRRRSQTHGHKPFI